MTDRQENQMQPAVELERADSVIATKAAAPRWLPIRSLAPRHRPRILTQLLALSEHDRYLRFGHMASDAQIGRYVDLLDFDRDEVFGIFNRRLELVAMAHLAYMEQGAASGNSAEFGVSVAQRSRGQGYGERLFDRAALHARNRGVDYLVIHALSENAAMLRIAQKAGACVERHGPEAEARLRLPPESLASHVEAMVEDGVAELDYGIKRQAQRMDELLGGLTKKPAPSEADEGVTSD